MQRDHLLLSEMIEAAERAHQFTDGVTVDQLKADQLRREPRPALAFPDQLPGAAARLRSEHWVGLTASVDDRDARRYRRGDGGKAFAVQLPAC